MLWRVQRSLSPTLDPCSIILLKKTRDENEKQGRDIFLLLFKDKLKAFVQIIFEKVS